MNLETAATTEMLAIALRVQPQDVALCGAARRSQTEGGLDVTPSRKSSRMPARGSPPRDPRIAVHRPDDSQVDPPPARVRLSSNCIRRLCGSPGPEPDANSRALAAAAKRAAAAGLVVNAGHGLDYHNVRRCGLPELRAQYRPRQVARAVMSGLGPAVAEMKRLMQAERGR